MRKILYTITAFIMLGANCAEAQVTIGSLDDPQPFSVLELISNTGGLRLPQLDTDQRDALVSLFAGHETEALGLQIFNTDTECVETWNGVEWIQACYNNTPTPVPQPLSAISCGITTSDNQTFTAPDNNAVKYEFFDGTASQGKRSSNSVTFSTTRMPANISVKYYYPASFLKPKMLPVEGGSYTIGAALQNATDGGGTNVAATTGSHLVNISTFNMSKTPITQAQYEHVMEINPSNFQCSTDPDYAPSSSKPAERVSWYDAVIFCNKLSKLENKTPCYSIGGASPVTADQLVALAYNSEEIPNSTLHKNYTYWNTNFTCDFTADGYRLPTESEWEYAARGGQKSPTKTGSEKDYYYSGSNALANYGWYSGNNGNSGTATYGTKAVKTKYYNALGLYDMSGNVWEWCWDWYANYSTFDTDNPTGATSGSSRVLRGGGWYDDADACRVSYRNYGNPYFRLSYYGFRVVCR
ncbi:MAG: formylglycine-generating enzyme family protein [Dysgonamonadaceae bacterium]|nr:formylglycine-generating enzyme family protein [Dysgonamonadaceae bacterium]